VGFKEFVSFIVGRGVIDYNRNYFNRALGEIRAAAFGAMISEPCELCFKSERENVILSKGFLNDEIAFWRYRKCRT
jgi:hypothetical protein